MVCTELTCPTITHFAGNRNVYRTHLSNHCPVHGQHDVGLVSSVTASIKESEITVLSRGREITVVFRGREITVVSRGREITVVFRGREL